MLGGETFRRERFSVSGVSEPDLDCGMRWGRGAERVGRPPVPRQQRLPPLPARPAVRLPGRRAQGPWEASGEKGGGRHDMTPGGGVGSRSQGQGEGRAQGLW